MLWYKEYWQLCLWHKFQTSNAFNKQDTNVWFPHYACSNCSFRWEVTQPRVMKNCPVVLILSSVIDGVVAHQSSWNPDGAVAPGVKAGDDASGRLLVKAHEMLQGVQNSFDIPWIPLFNDITANQKVGSFQQKYWSINFKSQEVVLILMQNWVVGKLDFFFFTLKKFFYFYL